MARAVVASDVTATLQTAKERHRAGRVVEAERLYREVLAADPHNHEAAYLSGVLASRANQLEAAVGMFGRAAAAAPDNATYHVHLGEAQRRLRQFGPATFSLGRALALKPDLAAAYGSLGLVFQETGDADGAIFCFERVVALEPGFPHVRQWIEAAQKARPAGGSPAQAMVAIASVLACHGRRRDGIAMARRALEIDPKLAYGHRNLANMLCDEELVDEALASYGRALEISPDDPGVWSGLARAQWRCYRLEDSIESFRRALDLRPERSDDRSRYLLQLQYSPRFDARAILEEARQWDLHHARPLASSIAAHANDRSPERRLRVGYVSPSFKFHVHAFFLFPLLSSHDHERFEIFCYSDVDQPDEITASLRRHADHWRITSGVDDAAMAAGIRDDRIDVLIDLTMHTADDRLLVFARKPAPVQIAWLGYPGTTGLSAIDYRITDPHLDPPGSDLTVYSEESLRLPDTFWCYSPLVTDVASSALPARTNRHVRFGCLNSFHKISDAVVAVWARVLDAVEGSRLVLRIPPGGPRREILAAFEGHGVASERIEPVDTQRRLPYLASYRNIDVCLDTFPYNGHTTSLDSLWMGVPVVTLVGTRVVGRAGLSQAMNLGLPELVARSEDEYVAIALGLAQDLDRLAELRATLRSRMEKSPLMDGPRFARAMEGAYRSAWRTWCGRDGQSGGAAR